MASADLLEADLDVDEAVAPDSPEPMETDEALYELVHDQRVEMPPMSILAVKLTFRLGTWMSNHVDSHHLGEVLVEGLFRLPLAEDWNRNRRPDIAFVSFERWPAGQAVDPDANAWDVVPDLAVEVVSPSDKAEDQRGKVLEYFRAGVRRVWVVYPKQRIVDVHESPSRIAVLTEADTLRDEEVLPGFALELASLFPATTPPAAEAPDSGARS
jgi:Uma2 family endonuclease